MTDTPEKIQLESLAYGGDAVGRLADGRVVFVPGGAPGDTVAVRIVEDKTTFLRGELAELVTPAPCRVTPFCPLAGVCGGCQWQHLDYATQCDWKTKIVAESIQRIGRLSGLTVDPCIPSPDPAGYRTVARYPAIGVGAEFRFGYNRLGTVDVVDVPVCPIATTRVNDTAGTIRRFLTDGNNLPPVREITIRASSHTEDILVSIACDPGVAAASMIEGLRKALPDAVGVSLWRSRNRGDATRERTIGAGHRTEVVAGTPFRIDERSFFQVHIGQTERLVKVVQDMLAKKATDRVVDGYGGVGLFSFTVFSEDTNIVLFDNAPSAVEDSRYNARVNGYRSFTAHVDNPLAAFGKIATGGKRPDVLVLDPPRTGMGRKAVTAAAALGAPAVIAISCNPATLARDLAVFVECGYTIERITPMDLFPQTYHVETVVSMSKAAKK